MKSVKIASLLLASGMLLGSVHSAVTPAYTAHAADTMTQRNVDSVTLEDNDVIVDAAGIITQLTRRDPSKLTKLLAGGELVIPETLNGTPISGIGTGVFSKGSLAGAIPVPDGIPGITKLTFEDSDNILSIGVQAFEGNSITGKLSLSQVQTIGNSAFNKNALEQADLPNVKSIGTYAFAENKIAGELKLTQVETIGGSAFSKNQLTNVDLPNVNRVGGHAFTGNKIAGELNLSQVESIENSAFSGNELEKINLSDITTIGDHAFYNNKLTEIKLVNVPNVGTSAFGSQRLVRDVDNGRGEVIINDLLPSLMIDGDEKLNTLFDVEENDTPKKFKISDKKIALLDKSVSATSLLTMKINRVNETSMYSISQMLLTIGPSTGTQPDGNGSGGSNSGDNNTSTTPDTTPDANPESPIVISPDPEVNRPHTVYAKRAMRLHSNVSLTNPTKSYKKQSRAKAASFRIQGVSYDKNGKKRYKVKGGYITASSKYVADSHFRSSKVKQVRVIGNKVNSYKNAKLSKSQQVRSYKKGTKLKVKRIVKQGRTTRFQLNNGRYITGNKQLLIMDHSK